MNHSDRNLAADEERPGALIYVRVSSPAQVKRGDGLASQEATCRHYAERMGYDVVEVFRDNITGGVTERPAMVALMKYLRAHRVRNLVVIIDHPNRFSRDIRGHWDLRDLLKAAGGRLESPNLKFGESSSDRLIENMIISTAQYQREQNAEQTRDRQRGRLLNGYWPFIPCMGLKQVLIPGRGRVLMRDEPVASVIQEAMEGYAKGRFQTQAEVTRFFESSPDFPKKRDGSVSNTLTNQILTKPLYAGYVQGPPGWDVPLRKGQHEGLVSLETFERIQQRLKVGAYAPARADLNMDFPLRGAVVCACCESPLTACWSKSKTGARHPYYMCFKKGCPEYRKSIRRDAVEGAFGELLTQLTPAPSLMEMVRAMFRNAWDQRGAHAAELVKSYRSELAQVESSIARLLDRLVDSTTDSVAEACERRIAEYERTKLVLVERMERAGQTRGTFEELFELAFGFLSNPYRLWDSGRFEYRKLVLRLAFSDRLAYSPKEGFRTPKTTIPFKVLSDLRNGVEGMAGREGMAVSL